MARNLKVTDRFVETALEQVKTASDVHEMRKCLSIVLVNQLRCSVEQAGAVLGVSVPTVSRLRKEFQDVCSGNDSKRDFWGGRRHSFLRMEEEKDFLSPFIDKARAGELVIIASIQEAFEQRVGKEVPPSTITRLLDRHRWRKLEPEPHHPDEDKVAQEAFKKRLLQGTWEGQGISGCPRPMRVMFEDEARFGRLMEPKACWAPYPIRPKIAQGVVREYVYAYTAASPIDGRIDFTIQPFLDTENVNHFLQFLSAQHGNEEVVLVWDGARAHTSEEVMMPNNIYSILLPPRSPRLNPVESFWAELREKFFHNFTFESIPILMDYLIYSLCSIKQEKRKLKSLLGFNWINNIILNAN